MTQVFSPSTRSLWHCPHSYISLSVPSQATSESVTNWLDFLSGSAPPSSVTPQPPPLSISHNIGTRPSSNSVSSTRSLGSFAVPPQAGSPVNPGLISPNPSRRGKRIREDDTAGNVNSLSDFGEDDDDLGLPTSIGSAVGTKMDTTSDHPPDGSGDERHG